MQKKYISPNFIVIGAGRSGTTWLYENLKKCSSVWLTPIKEIHYFDRDIKYPSPSIFHDNFCLKRLVGREEYNKEFRRRMLKNIGKNLLKFDIEKLLWCFKYYLGSINDDWYLSLFNNCDNKISGDITPAYQLLDLVDVRKIHTLLPNAKIIFLIRNPIYRTWSQLRKNKQNKLSYDQIEKILRSDDMHIRNNYLFTINNWKKIYPQNQFKLLFYDDIIQEPDRILKDVFVFLSINNCVSQNFVLNKKINSAPEDNLNINIKKLITITLLPTLQNLNKEIGGYTNNWLKEAEHFLSKN